MSSKRNHVIAIAGMIGVGKTTLARKLAEPLEAKLILEAYDENPFLAHQLQGDHRAALPSELFFLLSRASQLDRVSLGTRQLVITDYLFEKNRLFAATTLNEEDMAVFDRIEGVVKDYIEPPSMVIYLHDTVEHCLERIHERGREFEQRISRQWLGHLSEGYDELMEQWKSCPVVRLDCSRYDVRKASTILQLTDKIRRFTQAELGAFHVGLD